MVGDGDVDRMSLGISFKCVRLKLVRAIVVSKVNALCLFDGRYRQVVILYLLHVSCEVSNYLSTCHTDNLLHGATLTCNRWRDDGEWSNKLPLTV